MTGSNREALQLLGAEDGPTVAQIQGTISVTLPDTVSAWELEDLLEQAAPHIQVLSLDCFDTLIWRRTRTPGDVFFDLARKEPFARLGFNARLRIQAESRARSLKRVRRNRAEVTLAEIYRAAFSELNDEQVKELSEAELEAEKEACFFFPPMADLILKAKAKGLRVIIVSDTYLQEAQLRALIRSCVPPQVEAAIDRVFCSCELGKSKSQGMFGPVLEHLRVRASSVLHVGDNPRADCVGARKKGIAGIVFQQRDPDTEEILRLTALAGGLMSPESRQEFGVSSSFHGVFGQRLREDSAATQLGALTLGPILYGFARQIGCELERLRAQGREPKPVFLLRDAFLPSRAFSALYPEESSHLVSISRFASYAASFRSLLDVENYLARSAGAARFDAMLKQLLLSEKTCRIISSRTKKANDPKAEFVKQVTKPKVVEEIVEASGAYRKRLRAYLEKTIELREKDTLLFVDLGYEGTAQRELAPIFEREWGVSVFGCYLMASRVPGWQTDRVGLLDPSWCDDRVLSTLVPYVALLEDLCTKDCQSVVDYTQEGDLICADHVIEAAQFRLISPVQDRCVQFVKEAAEFFEEQREAPSLDQLRREAMAGLARLLFLPTEKEIEYLEGFRLDMNMGTVDSFALFDREQGLEGLRRRGLFFMEKNQSKLRMNYPVELRAAGLELSMMLLCQHRFGCEINLIDLAQRKESFFVLAMQGQDSGQFEVEARATHDGCFAAVIPVGELSYDLGLLLGQRYHWLQLIAVDLIPAHRMYEDDESLHTTDCLRSLTLEKIHDYGSGLLQVAHSSGFAYLSPQKCVADDRVPGRHYVCRVVFRPLRHREGLPGPQSPTAANDNTSAPTF